MAGSLLPTTQQWFDNNGNPLNAGLVYTYIAGTSTFKDTFSAYDLNGGSLNQNPVVLDSAGRARIFGSGTYKIVVKTSAGTPVDTADNQYLPRRLLSAPSGISDTGSMGDWFADDTWFYVYGATGWRRVAIAFNAAPTQSNMWTAVSTPVYVSGTQFTVPVSATTEFAVGNRVLLVHSSSSDKAGTVTAVSYGAPNTTVTVLVDAGGSIHSSLSSVYYSSAVAGLSVVDAGGVRYNATNAYATSDTVGYKLKAISANLLAIPYSSLTGAPVNALDYGADPTGVADSAGAIQTAMDYAWHNRKALYVPAGTYLLDSYDNTYGGKNIALYLNNGVAGPYQYEPFIMYGAGRWATKFVVTNAVSIDFALGIILNGESGGVSGIGISCDPAANVTACFYNSGAGPNTVDKCWAGGADKGFYQDGGAIEYSNCVSEFADGYGFHILNAFNTTLDSCTALTSTTAGLYVESTAAGAQEPYQSLAGICVNNCTFQQEVSTAGVGGLFQITQSTDTNVSITNTVFGNNGFSTGGGGLPNNQYGIIIQEAANISFTNCQFPLNKFGNIVQNAENASFVNCTFSKTGFILTPGTGTIWGCNDLSISTTGAAFPTNVTVMGCQFSDSSGMAINADSFDSLTIIGNTFVDCANGGLTAAGVRKNLTNVTVGDTYIYLKPSYTESIAKIIGNHFVNATAYAAGRYGIRAVCSVAVPAAKNIEIMSNTLDGDIANKYAFSTATSLQANAWLIFNDSLATSTPQGFPTVADANAPISTLYYNGATLVWKDAGGVVNNLY